MKNTTRNAVKQAIDILEEVKGDNEQIDETADSIGFSFADLEYEVND